MNYSNLFILNNISFPCRIALSPGAYAVTTFLGPRSVCNIERSIWVVVVHLNVVLRNLELSFLPVGLVVNSGETNIFGVSVPCVDLINVHRSVSKLQCEAITSLPPLSRRRRVQCAIACAFVLVEVVAFARTLCNLDSPESALAEINTQVWTKSSIIVVVPGVKLHLEHWSCRSVDHVDQELWCISTTLSLEVSR